MNLSRFFKTPQPLLPKFSFQDLQNSENRARLSKSQFIPGQHHIFDLILVFMAALIEGNIALANQRLGELETCSPEEIRRILHEYEVEAGCVSVLTKFPSSTNFSGRVIWGLLNQFLRQYSASYHQTLFIPDIPEVTKTLHKFDYANDINPNVQVDCFVRKKWRWQDPGSRDHEMGPRITKGFEYGGWKSRYFDVSLSLVKEANNALTKNHPRVCIFDVEFAFLNLDSELEPCLEAMKENYDVKVAVLFDAWQPQTKAMMAKMMPYFDYVWCPQPTNMDEIESIHRGNVIIFPFPLGTSTRDIQRIRENASKLASIGFIGGVGLANPSRLNWISALNSMGEIEVNISTHSHDVEYRSYEKYLHDLAKNTVAINFTLRNQSSRIITGRSFEVPLVGGLLLQEHCDDMGMYFNPGEHFLDFSNITNLINRLERLRSNPTLVKKIGNEGARFLDLHYSDISLVKYFSKLLSN